MPTLEGDSLVFRFPQIEEEASFSIDFQRTLRIPDSDETYPLPPGLGRFPLHHAEDFAARLPAHTTSRGGAILPIWQSEAMWINFGNHGPSWDLDFPVAIKIAAGKINAVTGEPWHARLGRDPQDYVVSPDQPWLDGYAVEKGVVRQFVAMPLGEGYSAEEQLTGEAEWGGLQISVIPLKKKIWRAKREAWERRQETRQKGVAFASEMACMSMEMGLAPGGRMHQSIELDPYKLDDWDTAAADRVFVTLLHGKDWMSVTGEAAPEHPPTAQSYTEAGLPWFTYYGADQKALPGNDKLRGLKSAGTMHKTLTGASLPNSQDVEVKVVVPTTLSNRRRPIAIGSWDE